MTLVSAPSSQSLEEQTLFLRPMVVGGLCLCTLLYRRSSISCSHTTCFKLVCFWAYYMIPSINGCWRDVSCSALSSMSLSERILLDLILSMGILAFILFYVSFYVIDAVFADVMASSSAFLNEVIHIWFIKSKDVRDIILVSVPFFSVTRRTDSFKIHSVKDYWRLDSYISLYILFYIIDTVVAAGLDTCLDFKTSSVNV